MGRRLSEQSAELEMISYGKWPTQSYPGVDEKWTGRCLWNGHSGETSLSNARRQGPCKKCGRAKTADAQRLSLAQVVHAMELKGVIVIGEYLNNRSEIECICTTCGEPIYPTYSNAMRPGVGLCDKKCKGDRISESKIGDAASASMLVQSHLLMPLQPYSGAHDPWQLRCLICGHMGGKTSYSVVNKLGHVCPLCGRARAGLALRLDEAEAIQDMLDAGLRPEGPYLGIDIRWPCTCLVCGMPVRPGPRLNDIRNGGQGGCTNCADSGFKFNEPASVYLVVNDAACFLKWGKANDLTNRLRAHTRQGFNRMGRYWTFETGTQASAVESAAGRAIRARGATSQIDKRLMRYKGYTETASLDEISVTDAVNIIERLARLHGSSSLVEENPRTRGEVDVRIDAASRELAVPTGPQQQSLF